MNELIQQLVSQLGVNPDQAKGGAGLLFKVAQSKLGGDFSKITQALPAVTDLIKAAPAEGGASKLLGGLASAIGGGIVYALIAGLAPQFRFEPLVGGYPAVYGLLGAFTFLLWTRLGQEHANQLRAFSLIGILLAFQLVFGVLFGGAGKSWIAEIAGFVIGFLLSFVLVPGGLGRVRRGIRHR